MAKEAIIIWRTPAQLGDTLVALPAFKAIREKHSNANIILVYTQNNRDGGIGASNFASDLKIFDEIIEYREFKINIKFGINSKEEKIKRVYYMTSSRKNRLQILRDYLYLRLITRSANIKGFKVRLEANERN